MDWKYKHFNQEALFNASRESVLEAARAVVTRSLGEVGDTTGGFVARGFSAWHPAIATVRITPAPDGTRVAVELLVERAAMRGYMLVDVGGYYNAQIDKWFSGISEHLGAEHEQTLVRKTTSDTKTRNACLAGCLVYLVVGACLGLIAIPLNRALFPQSPDPSQGPFLYIAAVISLLAGVFAFRSGLNPDAPAAKFIRERLQRTRNGERK